MATYVLPPGAWLSSSLHPPIAATGALHPPIIGQGPLHPPITGQGMLHPPITRSTLHPPITGAGPLHPPITGATPAVSGDISQAMYGGPTSLESAAALLTAAAPWRADDPAWTWQGGQAALLAQSLQHVHGAVVRPSDPRRTPTVGVRHPFKPSPNDESTLWCWGSEFRVHAVVADLAWRFRVRDAVLEALQVVDSREQFAGSFSLRRFIGNDPWHTDSEKAKSIERDTWHIEQVDKVLRAAVQREERLPEILVQCDDLWSYFRWISGLDAGRTPITWEVLTAAWQWATPLVMALKNQVAGLRPFQRSSRVLPIIPTPQHGTLPSGHATMAALTSEILHALVFDQQSDPRPAHLDRLARRIAFNRVVAGVHFPADSAAGYALGLQMAAHFVSLVKGSGPPEPYTFEPGLSSSLSEEGNHPVLKHSATDPSSSKLLGVLWNAARRENGLAGLKEGVVAQ